jgi:hypothetical protein
MKFDKEDEGFKPVIEISIQDQCLRLQLRDEVKEYVISTAKLGLGQQKGSNKTPLGWHVVRAKIGAGSAINSVFIGRRFTGEIYSTELAQQFPEPEYSG